jgi:MEDS: MEthanogen/methylotroph, DcmR Sensory domain
MTVIASSGNQFRHLALFYHGRGEYLAALADFIQASQARGDAVFIAVPKRNAQLVHQEFGVNSPDVDLVDMAELGRNPARIIPAVLAYAGSIEASTFAVSASRSGLAAPPRRCKRQRGTRRSPIWPSATVR